MNLELLESFGQNYPEEFDGTLDSLSIAVTCAFNKRGTLLAVGCNDGRMVIWDFLTRGIAKIISAHVHPVCSISWSRNGHKIASASTDNTVCIWNILSGECEQKYRFPCPVLKVQFEPRSLERLLVCPMKHPAVLVDTNGVHQVLPVDEDIEDPEDNWAPTDINLTPANQTTGPPPLKKKKYKSYDIPLENISDGGNNS
ncbi:hypothetical protein NQ317_007167 [Molorchus minor]|uniref:Uncharacterized protein n=1 Tax=Molorchus minor TaxID=1323400 RepID=A0ABQ9JZP5_9CUCU|nr:hypothetical protein NQ317_007167 [Molorchus minor]